MKKGFSTLFFLLLFSFFSCTNRDGEIIDLLNSLKIQNEELRAQLQNLKSTSDLAVDQLNKLRLMQSNGDAKIDLIQQQLKDLLLKISALNNQMNESNQGIVDIKNKIDLLQQKCAELIIQIAELNSKFGNYNFDLKSKLIAFYKFDGNANDLSGNLNHGKLKGVSFTNDRFNQSSSSLYVDGRNFNGVFIEPNSSFNLSEDFTISAWFYAENLYEFGSTVRAIICNVGDGVGVSNGWGMTVLGGLPGTDKDNGFINVGITSSSWAQTYPTTQQEFVKTKAWYNFTCTYSKSKKELKYFLNGKLVSTKNEIVSALVNNQNPITIGTQLSAYDTIKTFQGKLDDIGLWSRALNENEINFLFTNQVNF